MRIEEIAESVNEHNLDRVIERLKIDAEHARKERIYRHIDKLKTQIARLESCL